MEFEFENRYTLNEKMMVESTWANMKILGLILGIATTVLVMAAAGVVIGAVTHPPLDTGMVIRLVIGAVILGMCWYLPGSTAKAIMKEIRKQNGGKPVEGVALFGDVIVSNMGDREAYSYDRIRKVVSLKHTYVVYIDKRVSVPVVRDGFTKGDFASFKQFLREKRPDLKIPE